MNEVQIFDFKQMNVRMVEIDNEPWFVGKDVANILGYSNTNDALTRHVNTKDRGGSQVTTPSGIQKVTVINEAGLYDLIFDAARQSRNAEMKKIAGEFRDWATHEVLPSIRKHGAYMTNQTIEQVLSDPDTIIKIATDLKIQKQQNAVLVQRVNELEPKASYYDKILQNNALVNISVIAKDYGMSAVKMNKLLHELGVQFKQGDMWLLYAKHQKKGWTKSNTTVVTKADETEKLVMNTKWTQKGCLGLYELLKANGYLPLIEQDSVA